MVKTLAILGSTGSIGESALKVVAASGGALKVKGLTTARNVRKLADQVRRFKPASVGIADIAAFLEKTKKLISGEGGEILNEDKWGRRKLAYPIEHCREGFYAYFKYQSPPAVPAKLDQHFRVQESVIRTLTVKQIHRKPKVKKEKKAKV